MRVSWSSSTWRLARCSRDDVFTLVAHYQTYLCEIERLFAAVAGSLQPEGRAVVNVANPVSVGVITPSAWGIARGISRHLTLRQEVFIAGISGRQG